MYGCGSVKVCLFLFLYWRLRRYPVFLRHVAPVIPFCKGVAVIVDIALLGKSAPVIDSSVPPVFLIHEIFFCFFGQLQLAQFFNQIMPVIFLTLYGRIKPVTIKVLCKVDNVLQVPCMVAVFHSCNKFFPVVVKLHFQKLAQIVQFVKAFKLGQFSCQSCNRGLVFCDVQLSVVFAVYPDTVKDFFQMLGSRGE